MANHVDASKGWCCDGRTHHEHESKDGHCCQPEGTQLNDLPEEARKKAEQRLAEDTGADEAGSTS